MMGFFQNWVRGRALSGQASSKGSDLHEHVGPVTSTAGATGAPQSARRRDPNASGSTTHSTTQDQSRKQEPPVKSEQQAQQVQQLLPYTRAVQSRRSIKIDHRKSARDTIQTQDARSQAAAHAAASRAKNNVSRSTDACTQVANEATRRRMGPKILDTSKTAGDMPTRAHSPEQRGAQQRTGIQRTTRKVRTQPALTEDSSESVGETACISGSAEVTPVRTARSTQEQVDQLLHNIANAVCEDARQRSKVCKENELRVVLAYAAGSPTAEGAASTATTKHGHSISPAHEGTHVRSPAYSQTYSSSSSSAATEHSSGTASSTTSTASPAGLHQQRGTCSRTGSRVRVSKQAQRDALIILSEVAAVESGEIIERLLRLGALDVALDVVLSYTAAPRATTIAPDELRPVTICSSKPKVGATAGLDTEPIASSALPACGPDHVAICWATRALRNITAGARAWSIDHASRPLHHLVKHGCVPVLCQLMCGSMSFLDAACDAAALISMISADSELRPELARSHAIEALCQLARNAPDFREAQLHVICALAEMSQGNTSGPGVAESECAYVELLCDQGALDAALGAIGCARDTRTIAEAARMLGNLACSKVGMATLQSAGCVIGLAQRLPRWMQCAAHAFTGKRGKSRAAVTPARAKEQHPAQYADMYSCACSNATYDQVVPAMELIRALCNVCMEPNAASAAIHAGAPACLARHFEDALFANDQAHAEQCPKVSLFDEAHRLLVIMARAGAASRAHVLNAVNSAISSAHTTGRATRLLYGLRDSIVQYTAQESLPQLSGVSSIEALTYVQLDSDPALSPDEALRRSLSMAQRSFRPSGSMLLVERPCALDTADVLEDEARRLPRAQALSHGIHVPADRLLAHIPDKENVRGRVNKETTAREKQPTSKDRLDRDQFELGQTLGRGAYGTVVLAKNSRSGELVAIKQFHDVVDRSALKEQRIWRELDHLNVVRYHGFFLGDDNRLSLVAEYVDGWSLAEHLASFQEFSEPLVAEIVKQVLDGLAYLHERGIVHRDLKPANILVSRAGVVKITDFGVSTSPWLGSLATGNTMVGTPWYLDPQVIQGKPYNSSVDVFSLGCTALELATGRRPFHEFTSMQVLFRMVEHGRPDIPQHLSAAFQSFLRDCWHPDISQRPSATHLLAHAFLTNCTQTVNK
ncbi:Cytokinesis protein sepH [Porphyridium purpureum]|uniref:Cytokinesis protein sepH n=1 Tax=Porphyridium purpureum TaxID=35688 RepID=A0A5J4YWD0_PORPP|nr:Cytokinesis protein sepH [Porphyridium purpureum]|eukprot:POR5635..scf209_3